MLKKIMSTMMWAQSKIGDAFDLKTTNGDYPHPWDATTLALPGYCQVHGYTCGFTAVANVVHYWYPDADLDEAFTKLKLEDGVTDDQVLEVLEDYGLGYTVLPTLSRSIIKTAIEKGQPIIISVSTSSCDHMAVIYGYDDYDSVYIMNPGGVPWSHIGARWEYKKLKKKFIGPTILVQG